MSENIALLKKQGSPTPNPDSAPRICPANQIWTWTASSPLHFGSNWLAFVCPAASGGLAWRQLPIDWLVKSFLIDESSRSDEDAWWFCNWLTIILQCCGKFQSRNNEVFSRAYGNSLRLLYDDRHCRFWCEWWWLDDHMTDRRKLSACHCLNYQYSLLSWLKLLEPRYGNPDGVAVWLTQKRDGLVKNFLSQLPPSKPGQTSASQLPGMLLELPSDLWSIKRLDSTCQPWPIGRPCKKLFVLEKIDTPASGLEKPSWLEFKCGS